MGSHKFVQSKDPQIINHVKFVVRGSATAEPKFTWRAYDSPLHCWIFVG